MKTMTELKANPYRAVLAAGAAVLVVVGVIVVAQGGPEPDIYGEVPGGVITLGQLAGGAVILAGVLMAVMWVAVSALLWRDED